jgi:hypothetical protein
MHERVWAKVNVQVDAGVAGIVEALGAFPTLQTLESCEGTSDRVWICFCYGDSWETSWREAAEFVFDFFAPRLFDKVGDAASIIIRPSANRRLLIDLSVRRSFLDSVQAAIIELAREFRNYQRAKPDALR